MKRIFLNAFVIAGLGLAVTGCKNNNNEAEMTEEKEVATAQAEATEFTVVPTESVIEWQGEKPTGTHTGVIKVANGSFKATDSIIESGTFVIDMQSIEVTDLEGDQKADLEAHLKGTVEGQEGDFFNVTKFPEATFEVTGITEEEGQSMLQGNLTIKEETKNIAFPVSISKDGENLMITSEEFTIDRTKWNVNYGSKSVFEGLGDKFINDDVALKINLKAKKA
ncbi:polyisoprenoid-binding protein YceI [Christiangramia gaetbulicola]|uniref:Polyisoprenoid-binding protein YceI n=1 Tax=Christiangramia gaetbulicola TaxID=703340 RepID=A0A2T6AJY7_9FLAO|nr:YceI family protein [Christiangramia gaetbulicola]PTX44133.1 polyisoprenoid-binding protein YceI [Christiangramia gaetbulicola]